jgi:biotin operon repressor
MAPLLVKNNMRICSATRKKLDLLQSFYNAFTKTQQMETREKVIKAFEDAGKAMRPGEVAEMAGIDKKDAEKAIKKLKDEGVLFSPVRCFYDLQK